MELDPTQFLAQDSSDDESENDDATSRLQSTKNGNNPSILTSLGLTHVNSVTPYGSLAVSLLQTTRESLFQQFSHILCLSIFRIQMIRRVKCRATMANKDKHQRIVRFVICSFQIEQMHVDTRRIDIISMRHH